MMEEKVLNLLEEVCGTSEVRRDLALNLFETGLLDSMGVIELLVGIEEQLGIRIEPTEVERTEMDTPAKIMALLRKKQS